MPAREAESIAGRMIDAAILLMDLPDASHSNIERLIASAEKLLDSAGGWIPRIRAIEIWTSILEDAAIPLESTPYLGEAERLLSDHDDLSQLLLDY